MLIRMNTSLIIFDFDGVIVDSFQSALEVVREHQPDLVIREDEYRECFEGNVYEAAEEKKFCFVFSGFFDQYLPKILKRDPVDGIPEVIRHFAESHLLALISSTDSRVLREWLEKNRLLEYFKDILGADVSKSKVEKFEMLFQKYGVEAKDCVFITDTLGDLREAKKVGVRSIAVTYGFHSEETLRKGEFAALVHHASDIVKAVDGLAN